MITKDTDMTTILNSIANYPKKFHNTVVSPTKICIQFSHVESKLRLKAGGYYIKLPDGYKGLPITPEGVDIDQLAVWRHILGINIDVGKVFATTLRNDTTPDCRIKEYNGNLVYYDKPGRYLHGHSCFKAWMTINNVDFPTALRQIAEKVPINSGKLICTPKPTVSSKIVPYVKTWSKNGLNWWKEYNITNLENIYEIEGYEYMFCEGETRWQYRMKHEGYVMGADEFEVVK